MAKLNMHLAAIAYNLKKYLKNTAKQVKSEAGWASFNFLPKNILQDLNK